VRAVTDVDNDDEDDDDADNAGRHSTTTRATYRQLALTYTDIMKQRNLKHGRKKALTEVSRSANE